MFKTIQYSKWAPALAACQKMMHTFALWLCEPTVNSSRLTEAELIKALGTRIEGEWLWHFLGRKVSATTLLTHAIRLADLSVSDKNHLKQWVMKTSDVSDYFSLAPNTLVLPITSPLQTEDDWKALQKLMEAFYSPGLREGLPYGVTGNVTDDKPSQVTYESFKQDFLERHKVDPDPDAREACVVCGAELGKAHVDHWVAKAQFPLLSVCAHNLIPMCDDCNEAPNKGQEKVHTQGSFQEWFHPYKRQPAGKFALKLLPVSLKVQLESIDPIDAPRVVNLNSVFNLSDRWSKEVRAEYRKVQRLLERWQVDRKAALTCQELDRMVHDMAKGLSEAEPNHAVHQALFQVICDPARFLGWQAELEADFNEKVALGLV
ncbi:hypothetical protein [Pseudomonas sp. S3E17]|uniref:hypothetical protein n=1 Tax=Pseudomonas sp. S3E17 TaxID=2817893 RepID=UPI00209F3667|nr:hypothetical protein [Pseudomonas sp. S3E17]MCP1463130.1 hypothetical protein [Pseudomonas sp. S3E17]